MILFSNMFTYYCNFPQNICLSAFVFSHSFRDYVLNTAYNANLKVSSAIISSHAWFFILLQYPCLTCVCIVRIVAVKWRTFIPPEAEAQQNLWLGCALGSALTQVGDTQSSSAPVPRCRSALQLSTALLQVPELAAGMCKMDFCRSS